MDNERYISEIPFPEVSMGQHATTVLLACLGYANDAAKTEQLRSMQPEQWREVVAKARQHKVAQLLHYNLNRLGAVLPGALTEELKQAYRKNVLRNLQLYRELGKLLRRLQEMGIAVIALKGAHLAELVYDNLGLRTMGDIDLLVRKDDLLRVEQELLTCGFKTFAQADHHFCYLLPKTGLLIEIHWSLLPSGDQSRIDLAGLWKRAQPVTLGNIPCLALSPEDLILHLCLHTGHHTFDMRIRMLCDIGEVVRRYGGEMDWHEIGSRAQQWGVARSVYLILRLTQELLEVSVPQDWLSSLQPAGFDARYLSLAREQLIVNRPDVGMQRSNKVVLLWETKGLGGKLAVICKKLFLPRETMARIYPAHADSWRIYLYYPVRLKYLLVRHGRALLRLTSGDSQTQAVAALKKWLLSG